MTAHAQPDQYSDQQLDSAIEYAMQGKTVSAICETLGTDRGTFAYYLLQCNSGFARDFARALQEGVDSKVDRLENILEEYPNVLEARLMSENIKWVASKRKPAVYGDRLEVNVNETVSIRAAIDEGRQRALRDVTVLALPADASATGSAPVAGDWRAAEPAPNAARQTAVAARQPTRVKTALAGPVAHGAEPVATSATPSHTRSVIERFNAKNDAVSRDVHECDTNDGVIVDPLS